MDNLIAKSIVKFMLPFIQIYGVYVVLNGHLSPGGGFPGGAILGTNMILFALVFDLKEGSKKISHDASTLLESGGALWFSGLGLLGILLGANYLGNRIAGFPIGVPGELFSGGLILLTTAGIGIKVASTFITLFFYLVERKGYKHG